MKNILFLILISAAYAGVSAQTLHEQLKNATPEQRREIMQKLSPEQRHSLMREFRDNAFIQDLKIEEKYRERFKQLFEEYHKKQKEIIGGFKKEKDLLTLSNEEAEQRLQESFVIGEKLLANRKNYAKKFREILSAQQVLKLFKIEGMMRDKMMEHKMRNEKK